MPHELSKDLKFEHALSYRDCWHNDNNSKNSYAGFLHNKYKTYLCSVLKGTYVLSYYKSIDSNSTYKFCLIGLVLLYKRTNIHYLFILYYIINPRIFFLLRTRRLILIFLYWTDPEVKKLMLYLLVLLNVT